MNALTSEHQSTLNQKQNEIERLNDRVGVVDLLNSQVAERDEKIVALQFQLDEQERLISALKTKTGDIEALEQELKEVEALNTQLAEFDVKIDAMHIQHEAALRAKNDEIANLQSKLAKFESSEKQVTESIPAETQIEEITQIELSPEQPTEEVTNAIEDKTESSIELSKTSNDSAETSIDVAKESIRIPGALPSPPPIVDDLKLIHGIGNFLAEALQRAGIYTFRQIAQWTDEDIDFIVSHIESLKGRIRRENWVKSAKEEHLKKYDEQL
jgi:predicted flap endonuclease-1-like 5' DNA nuclease